MQTMQRGRNNANKSSADKAMLTKKFNQRNSTKERKEKMKENMLKILKTILLVTASVLLILCIKDLVSHGSFNAGMFAFLFISLAIYQALEIFGKNIKN